MHNHGLTSYHLLVTKLLILTMIVFVTVALITYRSSVATVYSRKSSGSVITSWAYCSYVSGYTWVTILTLSEIGMRTVRIDEMNLHPYK